MRELYRHGGLWFLNAYRYIIEDKYEERHWLMLAVPLARTPGDKKGGRALTRYSKRLKRFLDQMKPWAEEERKWEIRQRLRQPPRSQMIVVED